MFVLLKGATKEQSFKIGQEIAEAVTATNPKPVKLKFEKVKGKYFAWNMLGVIKPTTVKQKPNLKKAPREVEDERFFWTLMYIWIDKSCAVSVHILQAP